MLSLWEMLAVKWNPAALKIDVVERSNLQRQLNSSGRFIWATRGAITCKSTPIPEHQKLEHQQLASLRHSHVSALSGHGAAVQKTEVGLLNRLCCYRSMSCSSSLRLRIFERIWDHSLRYTASYRSRWSDGQNEKCCELAGWETLSLTSSEAFSIIVYFRFLHNFLILFSTPFLKLEGRQVLFLFNFVLVYCP